MTEEHVLRNRAAWDGFSEEFVEPGRELWGAEEPVWGIWGVPESEVGMLGDVEGLDAVELGCGTAYVSAWVARRGARPVGLDNSPKQLETARRFQEEFGLSFPLVQGDAERTPFPDASFDLAVSEYGAAIWCDPYAWIPEAARILRPGGRLLFLGHSPLAMLCSPEGDEVVPIGDRLIRDQFGKHRSSGRRRPNSRSRTARWSGCSAGLGSRSRTSSSSRLPRAQRRATSGSRSSGRAAGRPTTSGRPASAARLVVPTDVVDIGESPLAWSGTA
ncbi:MAG TPA: class I SAM-dependent methyltransferase [Actinomycetota bacterium]